MSLCFGEVNLLSTPAENETNWGATYWTSPQSDWSWPPVPEVDQLPFRSELDGPGVVLTGPPAQIRLKRFFIEKRFVPAGDGVIDAFYSIENIGDVAFCMANWEISRVPAGGLTYFPTGAAELTPIAPHAELVLEKSFGTSFYDHRTFQGQRCLKLHADGSGGYLAHLSGRLLLLKLFDDTPPERQAPGEGECEIFANEDGKYVEIEVQGPFERIAPGERLTTRVRSTVCPLPEGLERSDRRALRAFADEQAERLA